MTTPSRSEPDDHSVKGVANRGPLGPNGAHINPSTSPATAPTNSPCPGCGSTKGSARVGKFRSQCLDCNSTFPNEEFGLPNQDPQ
jgi:hypothetical protein